MGSLERRGVEMDLDQEFMYEQDLVNPVVAKKSIM